MKKKKKKCLPRGKLLQWGISTPTQDQVHLNQSCFLFYFLIERIFKNLYHHQITQKEVGGG